jgi:MFS family permease
VRSGMADRDLSEQSVGDLARRLSEQTSTLVRQELALAREEMQQKGRRLGLGGGLVGVGGLLGLFALGLLLAAIVLVLIEVGVTAWLSALIVAVAVGLVGGVLALIGKRQVQSATPPTPERAMQTSRQDVEYVKERARRR